MKVRYHIIAWAGLALLFFGTLAWQSGQYAAAFFFTCMLTPVMVGTVYFYNRLLIPRYLVPGKYGTFALYTVYCGVVSLWLQMWVMVGSFALLSQYRYEAPMPQASDLLGLLAGMYVLVFALAFLEFFLQYKKQQQELASLREQLAQQATPVLEFRVDRKLRRIAPDELRYLESMADYVRLHLTTGETVVTKEKIGALETRLPKDFVRIHRSYIIHLAQVRAYTREGVTVGDYTLPISRTYKSQALAALSATGQA